MVKKYNSEIKEMRINAGLSRPDVFRELGIPIRTQENWESGKKNPPEWVKEMVLERLREIKNRDKIYFKGVEVDCNGKVNRIPSVQFEQMFDEAVAGASCQTYVYAIPDDLDFPVRFRLVPDLKGYSNFIKPEEDEGLVMEIEQQSADRDDYLFFYATTYDEGEEEYDEFGGREYVDRECFAVFPPGSNRKFGYAYFRGLQEALAYIQAVGEGDAAWSDGKEVFSIEELRKKSGDYLKKYGLLTVDLEKYSIFTGGGECILRRV